jgi:hypothetical protein
MPRRIPCSHPGCTAFVDATRKTGLCVTHYTETLRVVVEKPEPRWPIKTVRVPQCTNIMHDDYRYVPVTLPKHPWEQSA